MGLAAMSRSISPSSLVPEVMDVEGLQGTPDLKSQPVDSTPKPQVSTLTKVVLCVALAVLSAAQNLLVEGARKNDEEGGARKHYNFSYMTVTLLSETIKFTVCLSYLALRVWLSGGSFLPTIKEQFVLKDCLLFSVPAMLYMLDNNIVFVILEYLDAAVMAIVWNTKIIITALLFRFVLKRQLTTVKWLAVLLLFVAVITTQADKIDGVSSSVGGESHFEFFVGITLTVIGAGVTSLAGVYSEWVMKRRVMHSFALQNLQLYGFGILFSGGALWIEQGDQIMQNGFFAGYTREVWTVLIFNACAGLTVASIFKYIDNVAALFSHVSAMMLVVVCSVLVYDFPVTTTYLCGLAVCIISLILYHHKPPPPTTEEPVAPRSEPRHRVQPKLAV